jgi:hypothetical protein
MVPHLLQRMIESLGGQPPSRSLGDTIPQTTLDRLAHAWLGGLPRIRRLPGVAFLAGQKLPKHALPARLGEHPRPLHPGRVMADMLEMPAGQLRHPMALFVPVKPCDLLFHRVLYSNDNVLPAASKRYTPECDPSKNREAMGGPPIQLMAKPICKSFSLRRREPNALMVWMDLSPLPILNLSGTNAKKGMRLKDIKALEFLIARRITQS